MSELLEALDEPAPAGLGDLGGVWDQRIKAALGVVLREPEESGRIVSALSQDQAWAWLSWAEGACSWAVRTGSVELLREALRSITLLDGKLDRRDLSLVATLARRAAKRLERPWDEVITPSDARSSGLPQWILSVSEDLPDTHVEFGAGTSFEFRRNRPTFDPAALEELLGDGSDSG